MFYLRLNKVKFLKNGDLLGKGEVQFMSFVSIEDEDFSMLGDIFKTTTDQEEKEKIVKEATEKAAKSMIMPIIRNIKKNQDVFFGDEGVTVYKHNTIPPSFHWTLIAIESDKKVRDFGNQIVQALNNNDISTLTDSIATVASISNRNLLVARKIVGFIAKQVASIFESNRDDKIGFYMESLNKKDHYLRGKRDKEDMPDTTGNMFIDYEIGSYPS